MIKRIRSLLTWKTSINEREVALFESCLNLYFDCLRIVRQQSCDKRARSDKARFNSTYPHWS